MPAGPAELDAAGALRAIQSGVLTGEALTRACLSRIAERDRAVQAWSWIDPDAALAQARACDAAPSTGPLHGLPIGVKDVILTQDMPTQYNSPLYEGFAPAIDAACVTVLRAAGAVILGKTTTVEFAATGRKPPTRNPYDFDRTPGGSSSGSAAAVADGHVPVALGTQTGGSILRPASYCGIYGFKPTWGLVSAEGCKAFAPSLDTVGWFARSAADLSLLLDAFDPALDPAAPRKAEALRIGVFRGPAWGAAQTATQDALALAEQRLRAAGAHVVPFELPARFDGLAEAHRTIMLGEGHAAFLAQHRLNADALELSIRAQVETVSPAARAELRRAYDLAAEARITFEAQADGLDAVLAASSTGEAPIGVSATGDYVFNGVWTLLHGPAVNVPGARSASGLPVGVTLAGPRFTDRRVLGAAALLGALLA